MGGDSDETSTLGFTSTFARIPEGSRLVVFGHGIYQVHPLPAEGSLTLGRGIECEVQIAHGSVSRRHALLRLGRTATIEDLGSRNGTKLHGMVIAPGVRAPLGTGDIVSVGGVLTMLTGGAPLSASESPPRALSRDFVERKLAELLTAGRAIGLVAIAASVDDAPPDVVESAVLAQTLREDLVTSSDGEIAIVLVDPEPERVVAVASAVRESLERLAVPAGVFHELTRRGSTTPTLARAFAAARGAVAHGRPKAALLLSRVSLAASLYASQRDEEARAHASHVLRTLDGIGDRRLEVMCLVLLGAAAQEGAGAGEAMPLYEAALARAKSGQSPTRALVLGCLATAREQLGDPAAARALWEDARANTEGAPLLAAVARAYCAALAAQHDPRTARAEIDAAEADLAALEERHGTVAMIAALHGLVEVASGEAALRAADLTRAHLAEAEAARRLGDARALFAAEGSTELVFDRLAVVSLTTKLRALRDAIGDQSGIKRRQVEIDTKRRAVTLDDGVVVALDRRRPLWLIVSALCERHAAEPGGVVLRENLVATAWPSEKMHPHAATNRLNVAVATLRKLGLRDLIASRESGYSIEPRVTVRFKG